MKYRLLEPSSMLLVENAALPQGGRVVLLNCDEMSLARWALDSVGPGGQVTALHPSYRAVEALRRVPGLAVDDAVYPDPDRHGPADVVLLDIPKGRDFTRAHLWTAAQVLRPGGTLYLAGPNAGGAKSAIKDAAALFGAAPVLAYKRSHRIAVATRPDDLPIPDGWGDPPPWVAQNHTLDLPGGPLAVVTMPGVFSWDRLDDGTALLLDHLAIQPGEDVLDLGCGYGVIGLAAARAGARVVLVDDHLLAVRCAQAGAAANDLSDQCTVAAGDVTLGLPDRRYDRVVSNPPFHQGLEVNTQVAERIVREAYGVLRAPGGRLQIVANRFLPYDAVMWDVFGDFTILAETNRFYVLEAVRVRR